MTHSKLLWSVLLALLAASCRKVEFAENQPKHFGKDRSGHDGFLGSNESAPVDTTPAQNEKIDTAKPEQPSCTEPATSTRLDFESAVPGVLKSDAFWASHGIKFTKDYRIVKTTRVGEPQPSKDQQAWLCILCKGAPIWNRLEDAAAESIVGRNVLASAEPKNSVQTIDIVFAQSISNGSFDLIDDDGSEKWLMMLFDNDGKELEKRGLQSFKGYSLKNTRNGKPLRVEFSRPEADIGAIRLIGSKKSGFFGFAFDNFTAKICPNTK
jgi:hypothetical protein